MLPSCSDIILGWDFISRHEAAFDCAPAEVEFRRFQRFLTMFPDDVSQSRKTQMFHHDPSRLFPCVAHPSLMKLYSLRRPTSFSNRGVCRYSRRSSSPRRCSCHGDNEFIEYTMPPPVRRRTQFCRACSSSSWDKSTVSFIEPSG